MNKGKGSRIKEERGRPVKYPLPERIDASPERIGDVFMRAKPKTTWRCQQERRNDEPR